MPWLRNYEEESEKREIECGVEKAKAAYKQATIDFECLHKMETDGEILRFMAVQLIIIKQILSSK